jgi:succinyl-CoA synthetase beta subunit
VLAAHGVCVASGVLATTEAELLAGAARLGFPLAAKIQSPDIQHKTEVGGVRLNLRDAESLCAAWNEMHRAAASRAPGAKIAGVLLEPMAPPGVEIIVGVIRDAIFGPIVMVGAGGVMTELFADVSYRLAPVSTRQALEMIAELNCRPLLDGFRGAAALDKASLARLIEQVSWLAYEQRDMIREIEINPVIVHAAGSFVADALIALQPVKR